MYRVIKKFRDKYKPTKIYVVGEEVDFLEERANEILQVGKFIEKIEVEKPKKSRKKTEK